MFLSGSGGVGKSYIVKMLHTDTVKLLQYSQKIKPEDVPILLTAATGVVVHNISRIIIIIIIVYSPGSLQLSKKKELLLSPVVQLNTPGKGLSRGRVLFTLVMDNRTNCTNI